MLDRYSLLMIDFKHQKSIISRPAKKEAHMDGYKLGVVETRFAELIWQHEPLTSGKLEIGRASCRERV